MPHRRQFIALAGTTLGIAAAGCVDHEPDFLVTDTRRVPRGHHLEYGVSIENEHPNRREGELTLTLVYDQNGDTETWTETDEIILGRGSSVQRTYLFENVLTDGRTPERFELETELIESAD